MKYFYKLITVFVVLSVFWIPFASAQTVNVPDANLAAIIRRALNLNPNQDIPRNLLLNIAGLSLVDEQIRDLTGLEHATNLQRIILGSNQVSDIRPLSGLTKLTHLYLDSNRISNIGSLSGLTNLQLLDVRDNRISDIDALSGLTNLQILDINLNRIGDLTPLSQLTNLTWLSVGNNPITDLRPLSNLVNLTFFVIDPDFDEKYPGQLRRYIPASAQIVFLNPDEDSGRPVPREELKRQRVVQRCDLGWAPQSPYAHHLQQPKVMMYALEFEFREGRYICSAIEIRTGDPTISDLEGWRLYLGTLYNPSYIPMALTQANSQITDNVLRLMPEMLGIPETFPCNTVGGISHPLPGVHYVLKTDANILVDTAYSCFIWGQNAYTTVDGINVESPRQLSSAALRDMETPRLERYIPDPTGVFITYMDIEDFGWDRAVLSDWLLPPSEPAARGAPSAIQRKIATTWGSLKAPE